MLGLAYCGPAGAAEVNVVNLGVSFMSFRYAEFPDNERLRNKETGFLPGLNAASRFAPGAWRIGLFGSAHGGDVDYDGATSSFRPHKTQTETTIYDGMATLGRAFNGSESFGFTPYLGAGYRYWRRARVIAWDCQFAGRSVESLGWVLNPITKDKSWVRVRRKMEFWNPQATPISSASM